MNNYDEMVKMAVNELQQLGKKYPKCVFVMVERKGLKEFPYKNMSEILAYLSWETDKE